MINDNQYIRRCKECWYDATYLLPELNKKIIYIDQFAISNMMKVLNPQTKAYKKGTLDMFWLRLFERVDSLCKLQLIICPDSGFHTNESLLSPYFRPLKQMYELLSNGTSFDDHETIKRCQLATHAENWISGKADKPLNLDVHSVVYGKINEWQDRFIVSVNMQYGTDWIEDLRRDREKLHKGLSRVFERWQSEKDKSFNDWFEKESGDFGSLTMKIYMCYVKRLDEIRTGTIKPTINDMLPSSTVLMVRDIQDIFEKAGVPDSDIWQKTFEYLSSPSLKEIPFIKISSMLYAALARKAASGRKKLPSTGMANDIEIISVLLPYCDAMFIDKECHGYLKERPLCNAIDFGTNIFSLTNKEDFLKYLNDIENNTPKDHFDQIEKIYGKTWREPYLTLYK